MTNQEAADELQYAIDLIKQDGKDWLDERDIPILEAAISALQAQEAKHSTESNLTQKKLDTISRRAAIDLCDWYDNPSMHDDLEKLPSAQPEIVRCGQCKYAEVADAQDNQDGYTCQFHRGSIWFSGSYCSWGERRTDGSD